MWRTIHSSLSPSESNRKFPGEAKKVNQNKFWFQICKTRIDFLWKRKRFFFANCTESFFSDHTENTFQERYRFFSDQTEFPWTMQRVQIGKDIRPRQYWHLRQSGCLRWNGHLTQNGGGQNWQNIFVIMWSASLYEDVIICISKCEQCSDF